MIVKLKLPLVLTLVLLCGCITCPPEGNQFYLINEEQSKNCTLSCFTETDEYYECTNSEGMVQPKTDIPTEQDRN